MKKIAVVNRTNLINYGSLLQSFALCEAVKSLGNDCEIIWQRGSLSSKMDLRFGKAFFTVWKMITHPKLIKKTTQMVKAVSETVVSEQTVALFSDFIEKNVSRKFLTHAQMKKAAKSQYDFLICGSDQVWCSTTLYVDPLMYLRFAPKQKRIAYAPSIGREYIPSYNAAKMRRYINGIPSVSVREQKGKELILELTGRDVPVVLDPTLMVKKERWDGLMKTPDIGKEYVLCYFLDNPSESIQKKIEAWAAENHKTIVAIKTKLNAIPDGKVLYPDCGPAEFIGLIAHADTVVTDSYHGMLFSIIYQRQFVAVTRYGLGFDQSSRQQSVLQTLQIPERFISDEEEFPTGKIDYSKVTEILEAERASSFQYLQSALKGER